jgi:hypothetical protein
MNDTGGKTNWVEKRRVKRREILERFSFYICVPKLGYTRHKVNDISELGIGFMIDTLGEFKMIHQETCDLQFYLNQSLYLSLKIQAVRIIERPEHMQEIGAIFLDTESTTHQTFLTLVKLVDQLSETAELPATP